jgi:catechol 1,2-dioxygenase
MGSIGIDDANSINADSSAYRFDPRFTQLCIDTMGPKMSPRHRKVMGSLLRHLHDFAREVELTNDEWMAGVHFLNSVGQISTKQRNEALRISDILGLES